MKRNDLEARNVGADLVAVTGENQTLHSQLGQATADRDQLQDELQECERYIKNLEDSVNVKDMERENLMTSYRKLITDFEKVDLQFKGSADEVNNLRMEVIMRDKRVQQLGKDMEESTTEISKCRVDLKAYERQYGSMFCFVFNSSDVTRSLSTAERTIEHLEKEKNRMTRDIMSTKDLTLKIESSKDDVQKQLFLANARVDDLQVDIQKMEKDNDDLSNSLKAEVCICLFSLSSLRL
jgi:chromosome segregation ATPase